MKRLRGSDAPEHDMPPASNNPEAAELLLAMMDVERWKALVAEGETRFTFWLDLANARMIRARERLTQKGEQD